LPEVSGAVEYRRRGFQSAVGVIVGFFEARLMHVCVGMLRAVVVGV
jgi:hypothetical protein